MPAFPNASEDLAVQSQFLDVANLPRWAAFAVGLRVCDRLTAFGRRIIISERVHFGPTFALLWRICKDGVIPADLTGAIARDRERLAEHTRILRDGYTKRRDEGVGFKVWPEADQYFTARAVLHLYEQLLSHDKMDNVRIIEAGKIVASARDTDASANAEPIFGLVRFDASVRRDIAILAALSQDESWDDDTGVDPYILGPLWLEEPPPSRSWPKEPNDDQNTTQAIKLQIAVPSGMTKVQSKEFNTKVVELLSSLSAFHAAMGGTGLRILDEASDEPIDATMEAPKEEEGSPSYQGAGT